MDGEALPMRPHRSFDDHAAQDHLRFLTCGSVDDGKSTLIGRLLYDTGQIAEDQLTTLHRDSRRFGADGDNLDFALLLDGLEAEREQGITIDVAWRYFSTPRRNFIVADTPGHAQYTRNMATGASACDAAVILVDATRGLTEQTRRHSRIVALFGIRHVVLAINKMDLVDHDQAVFETIAADFAAFAADLGFRTAVPVPISARHGDNVVTQSAAPAWHHGPALVEALECITVEDERRDRPFRFPVQYINRPTQDFRGYAGTVASGCVRTGDRIVVNPSGLSAALSRIVTWEGDRAEAVAGDAVTLVLDEPLDISRGDVLSLPTDRPASVERFSATLLWMDDRPLTPHGTYRLRIGARTTPARVTLSEGDKSFLGLNGIAEAVVSVTSPIAFDAFADDPALGGFVLLDRESGAVAAAGIARAALNQASNIYTTAGSVQPADRARLNGHSGGAVWLTGLSGSGKSTIAAALERRLHARQVRTVLLDGDNLRHGLNRDLGFSAADREENVRRTGEVARLFADAGVIALCALISPTASGRGAARERLGSERFLEVFINTPLDACRARDPKGLYARAKTGQITDMTGVGSAYEPPSSPDLTITTTEASPEAAADLILRTLIARGWLPAY